MNATIAYTFAVVQISPRKYRVAESCIRCGGIQSFRLCEKVYRYETEALVEARRLSDEFGIKVED